MKTTSEERKDGGYVFWNSEELIVDIVGFEGKGRDRVRWKEI